MSVRAIVGNRTGVASTNRFDEESLDAVVQRAVDMAAFAPADPLQPKLPDGERIAKAPEGAYVATTAHADPFARADTAGAILSEVERLGYWCSGYVATETTGVTIGNTSGAFASFDGTDSGRERQSDWRRLERFRRAVRE